MSADIVKITEPEDWATLKGLGADVVLDPVVLRTAHLFLLGRRGTDKPEKVWKAIESNIGALAAFVDAIILSEQIPVFNYGDTYDTDPPPPGIQVEWRPEPAELLDVCGEALTAVHISLKKGPNQGEYFTLVDKAYEQVREHAPLPPALVHEVVTRLGAFGYAWEPRKTPHKVAENSLTPVLASYGPPSGGNADADIVRNYLAGCLIFSGFAQKLEGDHVFPPGWSRLYAAAALPEDKDEAKLAEEALFRRLADAGNTDQLGIGRTVQFDQPTFLPYLLELKDTTTPESLFRRAITLREDDDVQQYVEFRQRVLQEVEQAGRPETFLREIDELVRVVDRVVSKAPRRWPVKMGVSASFPNVVGVNAEPGKELEFFRPYDWSMRQLPANRYRKLLLRLVISQQRTSSLKKLLQKRWEAV
jgi:hypothetical protein